jgi:hypothetical protein
MRRSIMPIHIWTTPARAPAVAGEPIARIEEGRLNMFRLLSVACVLMAFATPGPAQTETQTQKLPPALAGLPEEIRNLNWRSIDMTALQPVDRCRALLLMNNTLDELSANATAEADLMSGYLEKENLGAQFASTPPPPGAPPLGFTDAQKISVALLRGPMKDSHYARDLGDLSVGTLASYEQMYTRTCARQWSEFDESRHLVRCMSSFLGKARKLPDYDAWATAESARRELEAQQRAAAAATDQAAAKAQHAAGAGQKLEAQVRRQQLELAQMNAALAAAHAQQQGQQQQQQQQKQQPQQSASAQQPAGDQTTTPGGQPAQAVNGGYVVDGSSDGYEYGGYGGYGYAYDTYGVSTAGAAAAGAYAGARAANDAGRTGQYHGASSTWNREATYSSQARAQTDARMSSFHGARGGGRR